ncbi:MAG: 2-oxoacid:acceptor oxidoreductase family protein [Candidatus Lokiarchaeota archaeon]|nr:2-oxoacid:acceptor oxidoreductase family protein [Candidatus Lokiarchaeota archaeon]
MATSRYFIEEMDNIDQKYKLEDLISPKIPINDVDLLLGLEPLETIRHLKYISKKTIIILNLHKKYPKNVIIGSEKDKKYPLIKNIIEILNQNAGKIISFNFNQISLDELDSPLYGNIINLGVAVRYYAHFF